MPLGDVLTFVLVVLLGFFLAGVLSPLEALGWWAGWYKGDLDAPQEGLKDAAEDADAYVIFLSGIHSVSGEAYAPREVAFLERLEARLPRVVVEDVFPYSVLNRALTGQRVFSWLWRWNLNRKLHGPGLAGFMINVRNLWQVAVSADRRYGPIYNQGTTEILLAGLVHHGYRVGSGVPVTLIGYSGGGQIAVGASPYLKEALGGAPISVITLGGVISADPGILSLDGLYYLYGSRDGVQRIGALLSARRWPFVPFSPWSRAKEAGIIHLIKTGAQTHTGPGSYLDAEDFLPDGRSQLDATLDVVTDVVRGALPGEQNMKTPARIHQA